MLRGFERIHVKVLLNGGLTSTKPNLRNVSFFSTEVKLKTLPLPIPRLYFQSKGKEKSAPPVSKGAIFTKLELELENLMGFRSSGILIALLMKNL
ncbi:hypothetical protein QQP08_009314 [Theobroma cacao]|nr:hypothetical protein QQP08_009314 [Theobroma cacao]